MGSAPPETPRGVTPKESVLLLLAVAAALVAAFSFRVAKHPAELHDPRHAAEYEAAVRALPVLNAVRVRSERRYAARMISRESGAVVEFLVDPKRVLRSFDTGRLLYASDDQLVRILDMVRRGEVPPRLSAAPGIEGLFADRRGPYSCDVVLRDEQAGLELIRHELPEAVLAGEPVAREAERRSASDLVRGMILGLAVAFGWAFCRPHARADGARRLLAAVLPLALLCTLGWGVDGWAVLGLVLVTAAPRGPVLASGAICLLFPSMALKRMGVIFLCAGIVRWNRPPGGLGRPSPARAGVFLAALAVASALALLAPRTTTPLPAHLRDQPAACFVEPARLEQTAAALRGRGISVVGDQDPLPPSAHGARARLMAKIFYEAKARARTNERFLPVRHAAATDSMGWPAGLRHRLKTTDRRRVLWAQQPDLAGRAPEFISAELYRLRGGAALRRDGRNAALLLLAATGLVMLWTNRSRAGLPVTFAGIVTGAAVLLMAERGALPVDAVAAFPLVVMAGHCGSGIAILGLMAVAFGYPPLLWPAIGLGLAVAGGWLSRPRSR